MFVSPISPVASSSDAYRTKSIRNNDIVQQPITQEGIRDKVNFKSAYRKVINASNIPFDTPFNYEGIGHIMQDLTKSLFGCLENCSVQSKPILESLMKNSNKPIYLNDGYANLNVLYHRHGYILLLLTMN